ncbi:MAG: hypothetical protein J6M02_05795 [Clostridia bacterium]|nr:hypothetical protein [Clostridia bacterium]
MIKRIYFFIYLVIFIVFLSWSEKIIPTRNEISELQLSRVAGFDVEEPSKKVQFSLVVDSEKEKSKNASSDQNSNSGKKENVITVTSDTFAMCLQGLQGYREKTFTTGHIKNILIGENAAKNGLVEEFDFAARNYDLRFDTNVYVTKDTSAKDFLITGTKEVSSLNAGIENLSTTLRGASAPGDYKVVDILKMLTSEQKSGLIPAVELVKEEEEKKEWRIENSEEKGESVRMEVAGYGIIKDAKLISFFSEEELHGYNTVNENYINLMLTLKNGEEKVGIDISDIKVKKNFVFSKDKLEEVKLEIELVGDITEVSDGKNLLKEGLSFYEQKTSEMVTNYVLDAVKKSQETDVDFLKIKQSFRMQHPYRYEKMKDDFEKEFSTLPVTVDVQTTINKTYGMFSVVEE